MKIFKETTAPAYGLATKTAGLTCSGYVDGLIDKTGRLQFVGATIAFHKVRPYLCCQAESVRHFRLSESPTTCCSFRVRLRSTYSRLYSCWDSCSHLLQLSCFLERHYPNRICVALGGRPDALPRHRHFLRPLQPTCIIGAIMEHGHYDDRHHCYAWRIHRSQSRTNETASDGLSGSPLAQPIDSAAIRVDRLIRLVEICSDTPLLYHHNVQVDCGNYDGGAHCFAGCICYLHKEGKECVIDLFLSRHHVFMLRKGRRGEEPRPKYMHAVNRGMTDFISLIVYVEGVD